MSTTPPEPVSRSHRFAANVLWTSLGAAANLVSAFVLSPYVIRKLGAGGYGLWTLAFSFLGYYSLLDFGIRSAIVYFIALHRARGETSRINEILSTATAYYTLAAALPVGITVAFSHPIAAWFQVSPALRDDFRALIVITAFAWLFGFNVFSAALEAFQAFHLSSRIYILAVVLRLAASFTLLGLGYGLVALGLSYLALQALGIGLAYAALRSVFPSLRLSPAFVRIGTLQELVGYGVHSLVSNLASQVLYQSHPVLIGLYRPDAYIGYFSFPFRLSQYTSDLVMRMGTVTNATAVDLAARGETAALLRLATYANRYAFSLFVPLFLFLTVYGDPLVRIWISPEFALHAVPLIPVLLAASALAVGGQFNSSTILFSLRKHKPYGRALLVEAAASVLLILAVLPRYDIYGVAWVTAVAMVAVRGIYTPWLLCRQLRFPLASFLGAIYLRPLAAGVPVGAALLLLSRAALPGASWLQLGFAALFTATAYFLLVFFFCVHPDHRALALRLLSRWIPGRS
jgi:O-antigen/teichoic acid export membrane protein